MIFFEPGDPPPGFGHPAIKRRNGWDQLRIQCLPAELHNTPDKIPAALLSRGQCLLESGKKEDAKRDLQRIREGIADYIDADLQLGRDITPIQGSYR